MAESAEARVLRTPLDIARNAHGVWKHPRDCCCDDCGAAVATADFISDHIQQAISQAELAALRDAASLVDATYLQEQFSSKEEGWKEITKRRNAIVERWQEHRREAVSQAEARRDNEWRYKAEAIGYKIPPAEVVGTCEIAWLVGTVRRQAEARTLAAAIDECYLRIPGDGTDPDINDALVEMQTRIRNLQPSSDSLRKLLREVAERVRDEDCKALVDMYEGEEQVEFELRVIRALDLDRIVDEALK